MWISHALSIDHKPDLPLEKERVIMSGGRVSSIVDIDHITGERRMVGPARVYLRSE